MPLLFTFPSSTYKLLPSPRRFPAILLTSITVALNTLPYLGLGGQTALGTPFNPHHRFIRRSRFGLQIEHHGLSSRRSLAQFIYQRVCQTIDSCTAPSACPGSRLSEASPSSVATDTGIPVLFTLQINCYERQALRFSSYRLHAEMPRSWPFATISEPGKHLASCVERHPHLGRAIWALMIWNENSAFGVESLWSSQRMSSPRRGRLIMLNSHRRVERCALSFSSYRRSEILHPHLRRSLDWSHNLWWVREIRRLCWLSARWSDRACPRIRPSGMVGEFRNRTRIEHLLVRKCWLMFAPLASAW